MMTGPQVDLSPANNLYGQYVIFSMHRVFLSMRIIQSQCGECPHLTKDLGKKAIQDTLVSM